MITDGGKNMVASGNAMEELKALASPVHLESQGELTIPDDYDGGVWSQFRQQLSNMAQHSGIVIEQERWFENIGNPHEFFHFLSVPNRSHQLVQIVEQCRGELLGLANQINCRVGRHEQMHENIRSTMDAVFDQMVCITRGLHECNLRDRTLYEAYQALGKSWDCHMTGFPEVVAPTLISYGRELTRIAQDLPTHGKCIDTHAKQITWLYTNFKSFTGRSLNGTPSHSLLDPPMVQMEKDINAIKQKLSSATEVGANTNDMDKRAVLLESQVGSIQKFHERVGPLEFTVQGLIAGEDRQNYEVMDWRRHVDALTTLKPVVPSLVDMDGTVSALTTQVQLLDEEVDCLRREKNSLRHELTQVSRLPMNDVTLMMTQLEERVSRKYESQLQAHMDLVHHQTKQHDSMFHEFS